MLHGHTRQACPTEYVPLLFISFSEGIRMSRSQISQKNFFKFFNPHAIE